MKKIKYINPQILSSLIMLIIIGALLITISFSWFAQNLTASSSGLTVSTMDERITFGNSITVKKYISGNLISNDEYRQDGHSGNYYLWDTELADFAKDEGGNTIPITISGLLPGEVVEFEFTYSCTDGLIGDKVEIFLDRIEADSFVENIGGETVATHSVLSVYKVSVLDGESFDSGRWLVTAVTGVDDTAPSRVVLSTPTWQRVSDNDEENYARMTFRLTLDLEQYYGLYTSTNQLSEKSFSIGALRIGVANDE